MAIERGWDKEYGGLLYFVDCMGFPPEAYEHDMKLWWPHNEILIASLMAYRDTKDEKYLEWFFKTAEYCKTCFADDVCGEWYGYLRRDGKPTEDVDDLILKVIDAPTKWEKRRSDREAR